MRLTDKIFIERRLAKLMYVWLYRLHLSAIHSRARAALLWLADRLVKAAKPKMVFALGAAK